ncbi:MAG: phenylalanine--tRNA ligase subunit beta, partial [Candidatus Caldarchaeum sp.]
MRFPLGWLRDYVDFEASPEDLALKLTMAGLEVEELVWRGRELGDILVAEILAIRDHPNAERLTLCEVSDGERVLKIVCGARNMKPGDKVALAPHGALLPPSPKFPEGVRIKRSKIRGEVSEGMLCSESELGLGEDSGGIMILPPSSRVGGRLVDELGLLDAIMDVAVTPNRPDCLSVVGIAREVSAIMRGEPNVRFHPPAIRLDEGGEDISSLVSVEVLDGEGCPRYSCRVVSGVEIARSPSWLSSRLEAAGVRSINNVVDVTNYVLLEMGQPLHAFDYDLIEGRKIVVRKACQGEAITTLDGSRRSLSHEDLLICDAERPVALAGIMGGAETEVTPRTRRVLIESA